MKITFVQTGGTIDKDYPQGETHHGYEFAIETPAFEAMLQKIKGINPSSEYDSLSALKKDSLDITDEDRQNIFDAIAKIENDRIVVTHGTDTIHLTAEKLSTIEGKTIVLTGAMLPAKFSDSDANFNQGMAVAGAQVLPHGVYIALFGFLVPWQDFKQLEP